MDRVDLGCFCGTRAFFLLLGTVRRLSKTKRARDMYVADAGGGDCCAQPVTMVRVRIGNRIEAARLQ
jgi:hypothetical protein